MCFIRITRLEFAKFEVYYKNKHEADFLKRIRLVLLKNCKYNRNICF